MSYIRLGILILIIRIFYCIFQEMFLHYQRSAREKAREGRLPKRGFLRIMALLSMFI